MQCKRGLESGDNTRCDQRPLKPLRAIPHIKGGGVTALKFQDYKDSGRLAYAEFSETIAAILTAAIRAQPQLRLQHVQHRSKDPERLRAKLEKLGGLASDSIETVVKDLAGCRLVFYTNSDVSRFLSSGLVRDNFEIDWSRTKIHHPRPDASEASKLFISNNYVVKLKDTRVSLPNTRRSAIFGVKFRFKLP